MTKRVIQDPDYQLPVGYSKFQVQEIQDIYEVPAALNLPESYKIAVELLD